jgi:hypothetical protein
MQSIKRKQIHLISVGAKESGYCGHGHGLEKKLARKKARAEIRKKRLLRIAGRATRPDMSLRTISRNDKRKMRYEKKGVTK